MSRVLPILFNTDMVRAILDGRKTVTRRLPSNKIEKKWFDYQALVMSTPTATSEITHHTEKEFYEQYPPYQPGDILYVRETCSELSFGYVYKADGENIDHLGNVIRWHPSIHMPKEAARIWLKVKDVRVERLQDMNEVDTAKECIRTDVQTCRLDDPDFIENFGGIELFKDLWNSTIKKPDLDRYGWDANPWVWLIEFERCEKPEGWCV